MKTHEISTAFNIQKTDVKVIQDIVREYSGKKIRSATVMLNKVFGGEVTIQHYMCLGYIIGESSATVQTQAQLNQLLIHGKN